MQDRLEQRPTEVRELGDDHADDDERHREGNADAFRDSQRGGCDQEESDGDPDDLPDVCGAFHDLVVDLGGLRHEGTPQMIGNGEDVFRCAHQDEDRAGLDDPRR